MEMEATRFRVLLAEDDAVSRTFLCEAIRTCGGEPSACENGAQALQQARAGGWDLIILDHNLPGMNGDAVLAALSADAGIESCPALATSADADNVRAMLLAAGFAEVLPKPLTLESLRDALARHGCRVDPLDDASALHACGSASALERLRRLFAEQELPRIQHEFDQHGDDHHSLQPSLHRLRASCGFCGASLLARACVALHDALANKSNTKQIDAALQAFSHALRETRVALHARLGESD
ncbi:MAG TPA: response regulator [Rhodanobacteraceae bacterium]